MISTYFDIWPIFANEIVGDTVLFLIIVILGIFILSSKFKIPYQVSILISLLFGLIAYAETGMQILLVFVILIIGVMFYYRLYKKF
jgi:hypothetical protein